MKNLIIGYGVQGKKRAKFIRKKNLSILDPYKKNSNYKKINSINLNNFKYAYICTPEKYKFDLAKKLINNKVNVLVEKPFILNKERSNKLKKLLKKNKTSLYVAYNHRFEPNIIKMKKLLDRKVIGKIYNVDLHYGNGTSKLWKNKWRESKKDSIIDDLGVHLLDIFLFIFGFLPKKFEYISKNKNELKCYDYCQFKSSTKFNSTFVVSLINWRNLFTINVIGSKGSLHIENLCKWGPSKLYVRQRKFPSGYPKEKVTIIKSKDPTWKREEIYFKSMCKKKTNNLSNTESINLGIKFLK